MIKRAAFTMLEMVFVIVILGILAKFGTEIMLQIYNNFAYSSRQNILQAESESAVNQIANRLQQRIKDSVIASSLNHAAFVPLSSSTATTAAYPVLEWVGIDYDGWRSATPLWSGVIDLTASAASGSPVTVLTSPSTTGRSSAYNGGNAAIYTLGSNVNVQSGFGWNGVINDQTHTLHPVTVGAGTLTAKAGTNFQGQDIFEFYQLANSALAVELNNRTLTLYTDYQPWDGETYANGTSSVLMENVTTFKFSKVGDIIKLQVCVGDNNLSGEGEYSICKERTVF